MFVFVCGRYRRLVAIRLSRARRNATVRRFETIARLVKHACTRRGQKRERKKKKARKRKGEEKEKREGHNHIPGLLAGVDCGARAEPAHAHFDQHSQTSHEESNDTSTGTLAALSWKTILAMAKSLIV
eukprot:3823468-Rhodomonas_salina.1